MWVTISVSFALIFKKALRLQNFFIISMRSVLWSAQYCLEFGIVFRNDKFISISHSTSSRSSIKRLLVFLLVRTQRNNEGCYLYVCPNNEKTLIAVLKYIFCKLNWNKKSLNGEYLCNIRFSDDIGLITSSFENEIGLIMNLRLVTKTHR